MVVPMEIKTVAVTDRLFDGVEEEVASPVEKIQVPTLPDPTISQDNLPKEIDSSRDDNNVESILNDNCHDDDRLPTCCFGIDTSICDRGIDKLLCKTDNFLNVDKLAEYLCGLEGDPCFDVDCNTNCGDLIMKDADYGGDDDTAFQFSVQCGKLGDAGIEIKQQEIESKEEEDIAENPIDEKVNAGSDKNLTDGVAGDEGAPPKEGEDDIVRLEREVAKLEVEKERADEAAAVAAAASAAAAKSANLKKDQRTNQDERIAWLKTEFERLEREHAAAVKKN